MCWLVDDPDCPKKRSTESWRKLKLKRGKAIRNFTNPFEVADKSKLYNVASGAFVPPNVEHKCKQKLKE